MAAEPKLVGMEEDQTHVLKRKTQFSFNAKCEQELVALISHGYIGRRRAISLDADTQNIQVSWE